MNIKPCQMCGKDFEYLHPTARFCPECKLKRQKQRSRRARRDYKSYKAVQRQQNPRKKRDYITLTVREAEKKGLTYGQYVAKYGVVKG